MPNDQQLKLALAKMLPEKIQIFKPLDQRPAFFAWYDEEGNTSNYINDTELLHVCWLVEQDIYSQGICAEHYASELLKIVPRRDLVGSHRRSTMARQFELINATWQQRAAALCKVKGIEI